MSDATGKAITLYVGASKFPVKSSELSSFLMAAGVVKNDYPRGPDKALR